MECHSQSFRESGAQSTDWLLAGGRPCGLDAAPAPWMLLLPKLVPSCRRLMWRMTAVALKACCKDRHGDTPRLLALLAGARGGAHPPFAFGEVFPHLPADRLVDVLAEGRVSGDPERCKRHQWPHDQCFTPGENARCFSVCSVFPLCSHAAPSS